MRRILVAKVAGEGARASNIRSGGKIIQHFWGYRRNPKSRTFKITTVGWNAVGIGSVDFDDHECKVTQGCMQRKAREPAAGGYQMQALRHGHGARGQGPGACMGHGMGHVS